MKCLTGQWQGHSLETLAALGVRSPSIFYLTAWSLVPPSPVKWGWQQWPCWVEVGTGHRAQMLVSFPFLQSEPHMSSGRTYRKGNLAIEGGCHASFSVPWTPESGDLPGQQHSPLSPLTQWLGQKAQLGLALCLGYLSQNGGARKPGLGGPETCGCPFSSVQGLSLTLRGMLRASAEAKW